LSPAYLKVGLNDQANILVELLLKTDSNFDIYTIQLYSMFRINNLS